MSGHSHARTVMHTKQAEDQKRGKIFSKLARQISLAAKQGPDPEMNPKLKQVLEDAKKFNLPKANIEKAVQRGTGKIPGAKLEEFVFEAFGPANIAIIIEGITDNKNRALGEIKQILQQNGGKLAAEGSVKWLFVKKGAVVINLGEQAGESKEDLELAAIEAGAEDVYWCGDALNIHTALDGLERFKKQIEGKGIKIESASLDWLAKEEVEVGPKEKEALERLFEALDENEAVQDIYSNLAREA